MSSHNPDVGTSVTGEQFTAVRAFLQDHMEVHFVWFDFSCLPQKLKATDGKVLKKLNPAEEVYFKKALSLINLLYVHGKVLVLLDAEYSTRFWCLYEAFLASHKFDGTSLVPEQSIEGIWKRVEILSVGSFAEDPELFDDQKRLFLRQWGNVNVETFSRRMRKDDVKVTNSSDKIEQMKSLENLSAMLSALYMAISTGVSVQESRYNTVTMGTDETHVGEC